MQRSSEASMPMPAAPRSHEIGAGSVKALEEHSLSIVLPIHNQADHIGRIVAEYEGAFARVQNPREIILVTNGCTDNSVEVCRTLAEKYSTVRMVNSENRGWGLAVRLGLNEARGDILCYTNSARTTASDLQLLVLYGIANPDAVIKAHRRSRESPERKIGSFLYNLECRALFDLPTWDINATPKVFSRETYNGLQLHENGDLLDLEVYVTCKELGKVILEVPIYSMQRHGGVSSTNYGSAVRMYRGAYEMWREQRRRRGSG
jgi:glycosyltransferase involved in cell wall biosynthesis